MYKNILDLKNNNPFFYYYSINEHKRIKKEIFTRKEFFSLTLKAANLLNKNGITAGDKILHCFSKNDYEDVVFRMASVQLGSVPVTINWQADTQEKVLFKLNNSGAKILLAGKDCNKNYIKIVKHNSPTIKILHTKDLKSNTEKLNENLFESVVNEEAVKLIVYTSGTTGDPKGVQQTHKNHITNYLELLDLLGIKEEEAFAGIIVNPLHHTNASAFMDMLLRKPNTNIHLFSKYSSVYWKTICSITQTEGKRKIIAPVVARHFEYLNELKTKNSLPVSEDTLKQEMKKIDFIYGSAPAGPNAIKIMHHFTEKIPCVRYGSTETTLHVIGIPDFVDQETRLKNFITGWEHKVNNEPSGGYYIGRAAEPFVEVKIVKSVDKTNPDYFKEVEPGIPGYIVTRGGNVMKGYVNKPEETAKVFDDSWYLNLGDIGFYLINPADKGKEIYWMNRDIALMIKGGANYSCSQISNELSNFIAKKYKLASGTFFVEAIGLKTQSESEDSCCVTIELISEEAKSKQAKISKTFLNGAGKKVSKGAKPDYFRFGKIPRNFKGAILYNELKREFTEYLQQRQSPVLA